VSDIKSNLYAAMFAVQCDVTSVAPDRENKHLGNKYASLAACWNALRPLFARHGLLVTPIGGAPASVGDDWLAPFAIRVVHVESGESELFETAIFINKKDPQGFGSATTYAHRYHLMTTFGMPPDDDDGTAASVMAPDELSAHKLLVDDSGTLDELRKTYTAAYRLAGSDASAVKDLTDVKNARKRAIECHAMVAKHQDAMDELRDQIADNNMLAAAEAYHPIPDADRMTLNLAPSKGGWLTTDERAALKSDEFGAAMRQYIQSQPPRAV